MPGTNSSGSFVGLEVSGFGSQALGHVCLPVTISSIG